MSYCDCKICQPDQDDPPKTPSPKYNVTVMMTSSGYWAVKAGSKWVEIRGTLGMPFSVLKEKVFTPEDDVRAHPNSTHFDREYGTIRKT